MKCLLDRALVFLFSFALISAPVRADILFLDFNNNPEEIARAERAAKARGERLRVIPSVSREAAQQLKEISRSADSARKELISCRQSGGNCDSQNARAKELEEAQRSFSSRVRKLGPELLASELRRLKSEGVNLSSVVMSGHHYNGRFWGLFGNLRDTDIKAAFDQVPELRNQIGAMHLWGCYTTNLGALEYNWKGIFPNARMITGFDELAPSGERPANLDLLENTLLAESQLVMARDINEVSRILKSIPHAMDGSLSFQVCLDGSEVTSFEGVMNIQDEIRNCQKLDDSAGTALYRCYANAEPDCPDLPTDPYQNELRALYSHLQETRHCDSILAKDGQTRVTADHVLRLIHDRHVRSNFEAIHKDELNELNRLLDRIGVDESLRFKNLADMTRGEFVNKVQKLNEAYRAALHAYADNDGLMENADVAALQPYLGVFKALSNPECIPETWMDRGASDESPCEFREHMRSAKKYGQDFASFTRVQRQAIARQRQSAAGADQLEIQRRYSKLVRALENNQIPATQRAQAEAEIEQLKQRYWALDGAAKRASAQYILSLYQQELERMEQSGSSPALINMVRGKVQEIKTILGN